jgi:hypothetical protein
MLEICVGPDRRATAKVSGDPAVLQRWIDEHSEELEGQVEAAVGRALEIAFAKERFRGG